MLCRSSGYEGRDAPPVVRFEGVDIIELRKVDHSGKFRYLATMIENFLLVVRADFEEPIFLRS